MKNKKHFLMKGFLTLFLSISVLAAFGQNLTVQGTVTDEKNEPVIGASVKVVGVAGQGTVTNVDGKFTLPNVPAQGKLRFTNVGMQPQEIAVNGQTTINIVMKEDAKVIGEVVVTALGIKREKKALGYAIQEVKGEDILAAKENNLANSLSGKVSGLQIIRSSNGPGASSKILLRGNNSVTGLNQPLIVVDGVPIDNFTGADNNDYWNPSADKGNGISDINPEDIASISVLKGGAAAALYGTRAGNGVILITTKTGRKNDGLGITISSSVAFENIFMHPELQKTFGQGSLGVYAYDAGGSWGPKIEGQEYTKWDKTKANMQYYDNLKNYFNKPGINLTENVSFSQQFNNTSLYTSLTRMDDKSKIPGADLSRTNFLGRSVSNLGKFTLDTKIQYIKTNAKNRPISGNNSSNPFLTMYRLPHSLDIRDFSNPKDNLGKMTWYDQTSAINPYWLRDYKLNNDVRDRFIMFGSLKYAFTNWLDAEIKGGTDMYFTEYESKTYGGSPLTPTGRYSFGEEKFFENNFSALISAHKDNIFGKWGGALSVGGNLMEQKNTGTTAGPDELQVPDLFTYGNAKNKINASRKYWHKKINSIYETAQVNYGGYYFLDATLRSDWSSALAKENNPFHYYSLSTSLVVSDMINSEFGKMPDWFTYAKLRGSYAEVGNDLGAYELYNTYWIGKDPDNHMTAGTNNTKFDYSVRNELIKTWEIGTEVRFFNNRLGFDLSWYKQNAINQLLNLPIDPLSGYASKKINAGNIQNQGIELMINARPIETKDFNWNIQANISKNSNTILELSEDVKNYQLGGYDNVRVYATVGGNYGEIYGTTYKRVTDANSPYVGKILVDGDGLPIGDPEIKKVGDQQAKALVGITNSFDYKGFSLSFLIDARIGGQIFSATNQLLQSSGAAAVTAPNEARENFIVDGVLQDEKGNITVNSKLVSPQNYWARITGATGNLGITEANIYDATNIRIRNIQLNYDVNRGYLKNTPIKRLKLGFSCNNVLMLSSHLNGIDPESVYATSTNAVGFEGYAPPTSRTYLFNITLGF